MPIYQYECAQCGRRFDELVAYDRRHEVRCPQCGGEASLKVSGFAVTGSAGASASSSGPRPRFT